MSKKDIGFLMLGLFFISWCGIGFYTLALQTGFKTAITIAGVLAWLILGFVLIQYDDKTNNSEDSHE